MKEKGSFLMILIFIAFTFNAIQSVGQWSQGTGMDGGDYRCLMKTGSDIYAGSQYGGVFRSTNNGSSWIPCFSGLPAGVSVVRLLAKDTLLFAGTGYWSKQGQGIYRSGDQGATWVPKNNGIQVNPAGYFTDLDITGLAKTTNYIYASTRQNGIYRSADNGDNWVKVFDEYGPDSAFREIYSICAIGDAVYAGGNFVIGVHRSYDQGETWDVVSTGFPSGFIVYQLTSAGSDLYVRGSHGFYWSPTNGDYFVGINNGIGYPEGAGTGAISAEGSVVLASTYDGSEGPRTYKSTNKGASWTVLSGLSTSYVQASLISGQDMFTGHIGNYGVTSNGGGVIKSADGGATWANSSVGLRGISCRALASDGASVYGGSYYYSGMFKSTNAGASWSKTLLPGTTPNYQILAMTNAGTTLYAGVNATNGVFKSVDGGITWTQSGTIGKQVWAVGTNATYVFAGTSNDGMRRSSNGGTSWTTINTGLPTVGEKSVRAMLISGTRIYIGNSRGVFWSANDGTNWTAINGGIGSPGYGIVKTIAVKGDTLWAGATSGVIMSVNHGATWTTLPSTTGINYALLRVGNTLYAGGTSGVYVSSDWGSTWSSFNAQFPNIPEVNVLYMSNDILYAGTYGQAVWQYSFAQPPTAFAVTGGGAYCGGGAGLPVGLSGSQTGVNYTLYNNGVAQVPAIAGTGAALTFGNQTAGTYTVTGTNSFGTTPMTGSAVVVTLSPLAVSLTISADVNPIPENQPVTLTALPVNGGANPVFQWQVNGVITGNNTGVMSYQPTDRDTVTCLLTSSESCTTGNPATSNVIVIRVISDTLALQGSVSQGDTNCYSATNELIVAGNGTTFTVQAGGSATMIAGGRIVYLPGTTVDSGGYIHGYISTVYCTNPVNPLVTAVQKNGQTMATTSIPTDEGWVRVYPNPVTERYTIELTGDFAGDVVQVEVIGMNGLKVYTGEIRNGHQQTYSATAMQPGLYFIRLTTGDTRYVVKLIRL
jgi:hypothetical protein